MCLIRFNLLQLESFTVNLCFQLEQFTGELQAYQLIIHALFGSLYWVFACGVGDVFLPDNILLESDTYTNCALMYNLHLEVWLSGCGIYI